MLATLTRYLGLLRQADFRRLWLSMSVSTLGSEVTFLALPLVAILVLKATPVEVAALGAMPFVAFALFGLPAGVWVDRLPRKRVMVAGDLGRAAILILVPIAAVAGALQMWELYVIAFAAGVLTVFFEIAYQSILPELVNRDRLAEGNSRLEVSRSASQVLGPGVGGALIGAFGAPIAIVADALSYLGSAAFLIGLHPSRPRALRTAADSKGLVGEILEGLRFYRRSPILLSASAAVITLNVGFHMAGAIALIFYARELEMTPEAIGIAFSIGSIGFLIGAAAGAAVGRRIGVGRTLMLGCGVSSAAWYLLAFASRDSAFVLLAIVGIIQGLVLPPIFVNNVALRQTLTPDELSGRVNATARWMHWTAIPFGQLAGGLLATIVGLRGTIAIGATVGLLSALFVLLSPMRHVREMPAAVHPPRDADSDGTGVNPLDEPTLPLGQAPAL
ncbi:MAG TPA: MFS transporter [Candidatus Limnocylindrales bacterium]|nr:MFS transporter [Candidatus Limnocylindrales bacterium]